MRLRGLSLGVWVERFGLQDGFVVLKLVETVFTAVRAAIHLLRLLWLLQKQPCWHFITHTHTHTRARVSSQQSMKEKSPGVALWETKCLWVVLDLESVPRRLSLGGADTFKSSPQPSNPTLIPRPSTPDPGPNIRVALSSQARHRQSPRATQ